MKKIRLELGEADEDPIALLIRFRAAAIGQGWTELQIHRVLSSVVDMNPDDVAAAISPYIVRESDAGD